MKRTQKWVVVNFSVFIDQVESGAKKTTIRRPRKRPIKRGDVLRLYTGMRTKSCRLIKTTMCEQVTEGILISMTGTWIGGRKLSAKAEHDVAVGDGFSNLVEFRHFFASRYGRLTPLVMIRWR